MKLVQLYSNDNKFKTVTFSPGFNIVLGRITDKNNYKKDSHNLGKSTLTNLIDFMLLKELNKKSFLKKDIFSNYIFFLEIQLNDGRYLTIKRAIEKNTKISFKISNTKNNNFVNEINWDYENLALSAKEANSNPKTILNMLLGFNVLTNKSYRSYLNYFLRTQADYSDEFHLSKFLGSDSNWKPLLSDLLGFNSKMIEEKYRLDKDYSDQKAYIKKLENENQIDTTKVDKLKGLIQIKQNEKESIENSLDKFNFYINEKNIDKTLVDKVESEISSLNSTRYNLEMDINSLNESIENKVSFDIQSTINIFKEVKIYFSDQLKKSYEDLIKFNETITTDRNKYIIQTLAEKRTQLKEVDSQLVNLNKKRTELLSALKQSDIFKKYKQYEKKLIIVERDLQNYTSKLENIKIIDDEKEKLDTLGTKLDEIKKHIKEQVESENSIYNSIRTSFSDYVKFILDKPGLLSIEPNSSGNLDFKAEILDSDDVATSESNGHTYRKILCACFDLAILTNYSTKSFFKFVYHDGCLEALDPRKRKKYLDLIIQLCNKYDIQYILTMIESDIPEIHGKKYTFPNNTHIAVELSDANDTSTLFGVKF